MNNQTNKVKLYVAAFFCVVILLINIFYASKIYQGIQSVSSEQTSSVSTSSQPSVPDTAKTSSNTISPANPNPSNPSPLKITSVQIVCTAGDLCKPPVFSAINIKNISSSGAVINWKTSQPATTEIFFSTTTIFSAKGRTQSLISQALSNSHEIDMGFLESHTTYNYMLQSSNSNGIPATSTMLSFTTLN